MERLAGSGRGEPPEPFDATLVADLPEAARRWLTHAISPGTPLWPSVVLTMCGEIRLGSWRPFTATQVLAPPHGFIWAATARFPGLPVTGFDRYSSGRGQMNWRLGGLLPVMTATGADVTRSAAGRLAGEMALAPTTFRGATWTPGIDDDHAVATWRIGDEDERAEFSVGVDGRLVGVDQSPTGGHGTTASRPTTARQHVGLPLLLVVGGTGIAAARRSRCRTEDPSPSPDGPGGQASRRRSATAPATSGTTA